MRGRARKHLSKAFPDAEVLVTPDADYACRVFVDRTELSGLVKRRVQEIDYANFKGSVRDPALHHLYLSIWRAGWSFQNKLGQD